MILKNAMTQNTLNFEKSKIIITKGSFFDGKIYRVTLKNSAPELRTITRTKSLDRSMFKSKKQIKSLKQIRCGKKFKGAKFAASTFDEPILWKSRKLHKGGYLKGQYRPKEK